MAKPPRIWISNKTPAKDEVVRVRAQITHVMESGFRVGADGKALERNIVTGFTAKLGEDLLMEWLPEPAVSQNPYIEFTFVARSSGKLRMAWTDLAGVVVQAEADIQLA